jgi:hypothetical protein
MIEARKNGYVAANIKDISPSRKMLAITGIAELTINNNAMRHMILLLHEFGDSSKKPNAKVNRQKCEAFLSALNRQLGIDPRNLELAGGNRFGSCLYLAFASPACW